MTATRKWDTPTRILHWTTALSLIGLALLAIAAEGAEEMGGGKA